MASSRWTSPPGALRQSRRAQARRGPRTLLVDTAPLDVGASTGGLHGRSCPALCSATARPRSPSSGQTCGGDLDGAHQRANRRRPRRSPPTGQPGLDRRVVHLAGTVLGPIATTCRAPDIVALVKPQFEAGKGRTDHGVSSATRPSIARSWSGPASPAVLVNPARRALNVNRLAGSGPEGSREFLVHRPRAAPVAHATARYDHPNSASPTTPPSRRPSTHRAGCGWCRVRGIDALGRPTPAARASSVIPVLDALVVLGGDGTFPAARAVARIRSRCSGSPLARSGSPPSEVDAFRVLGKVAAGEFTIDERMALRTHPARRRGGSTSP